MDELVQFLRDRLDEDEATAKAADSDQIEATPSLWGTKYLTLRGDHNDRHTTELPAELADHIARHDPARVLAEVEAKRRLLLWAESAECGMHLVPIVDNLVGVYRDHPDFDPAWMED